MKLHLRGDSANGIHTKFTVFMNEANCGQLCMKEEDAVFFHNIVLSSTYRLPNDEFISSGEWIREEVYDG